MLMSRMENLKALPPYCGRAFKCLNITVFSVKPNYGPELRQV